MRIAQKMYDITPTGTFWLIGYGAMVESRKHPAEGVHDPIYANALLLEEDDHRVFVINLDLVELESEYCDALRPQIAERFGLDERCILLSVTHNHQSVRDYHHTWETGEYDPAYEEFLTQTIYRAYEECAAELAPVDEVRCGRGLVTGYYGNRDHADQLADNEVIRVEFWRDGRAVAGLVNWACHSTLLDPANALLSAELAGGVRAELAKGCGYAPLMLLGAAGDCSPRMFARRKDFAELAEFSAGIASAIEGIACDQVLDVHFGSVREVSWRIAYSMDDYRPYWEARLAEADALLASGDKSAKINGVSPFFFKKLVNKKLAIDAVDITLPSQVIALGDLVIVTSEGELASAFGKQIKASRPDKCVVICGYTNGFQHYMMPAEEYGVGMESLDSVFPEGEVEHYIEAIEAALAKL